MADKVVVGVVVERVGTTVDVDNCCDDALEVAAGSIDDTGSEVMGGEVVDDEPAVEVVLEDERGV